MLRRWIIRSFFLMPILLCAGGWAWSGGHRTASITYRLRSYFAECGTGPGIVFIGNGRYSALTAHREGKGGGGSVFFTGSADGWEYRDYPQTPARFWPPNDLGVPLVLGVCFYSEKSHLLFVSYWSLIFVFSVPLLIVWRKTRPNPHPKTAFPIELAAPTQHP